MHINFIYNIYTHTCSTISNCRYLYPSVESIVLPHLKKTGKWNFRTDRAILLPVELWEAGMAQW